MSTDAIRFHLHKKSPLSAALKHCLVKVLGVPTAAVVETERFSVLVQEKEYAGLLPTLRVLRSHWASTEEQKAFLGANETEPLVNQWVSAASLLAADAVEMQAGEERYRSVSVSIYTDVERAMELAAAPVKGYLAGTPRATIADVLLYVSLHGHPLHAGVLPQTMAWSAHVQEDEAVKPFAFAHVAALQKEAGKKEGGKAPAVFVMPSAEEINRRREEKERLKAEKAAAAAKAGTTAPAAAAKAPASKKSAAAAVELSSSELCIRVGRLTNLRRHPEADRLYVEDMDLGDEMRTIVSGLVDHYTADEINDTLCLVICNMKPKALKGVTSHGMVLCASNESSLKLVRPPAGAKPGDRIIFGEAAATGSEAVPAILSGNRMPDLLAHLHTNADCVLSWKEQPARHALGIVSVPDMKDCIVK